MNSGSIVPMLGHAIKPSFIYWIVIVLSILCSANASAGEALKHGVVMARSVVLDENGQPILVEYNADGSEGKVIGISSEYANDVRKLKIISAYEYRMEQERLKAYQEQHKDGLARDADVLAREAFLNQKYTTADGKTEITPPVLPEYVKSVLVRGRSARITDDANQLALLSFSVDLSQSFNPPDTGSIVLNPKGQVITSSTLNIAPRVGFFGDPKKAQDITTGLRKSDDEIFGPIKNVKVYVSPEVFPGSVAVTDSKGKYSMRFHLPYCPGGIDYNTDMWAELYYVNFSPNGMPALPYYLRRQDWTYCYDLPPYSGGGGLVGAMSYVNAMAVVATMSTPMYALDMKVDVMFLSGKVTLKNPDGSPINISTTTEYNVNSTDSTNVAQQYYDFDGDGKPDVSVLGNMVDQPQPDGTTKKVFQAQPNGDLQVVFFSANTQPNGQPDAIRVADKTKNMAPNGLLKSITEEDLRKTDVLVFRESTGELVLERKGLTEEEAKKSEIGNNTGINDKEDHFFYRIMLRGPMDSALNIGGGISRSGTWNEWATRYQLPQSYQKREADHLKSGEWIRLVVINRVTGYMATQRVQLNDASQNAAGFLSLPVPDMALMPPNLKIWAERDYTHENGLEKGKEARNNLIGAEGGALASDDMVTVYTEWFDEEGRPLPEGLGANKGGQFGLTGRLAKISGSDQITAVAHGKLANFAIKPGRHTEVLRVKDNFTTPEHFYIHVNGTQKDENPDFATAGGTAEPPLDTRPKNPTPFLTPLYDENKDWQTWSAWNQIKRAYDAELIDDEPLKPLPSYVWHYRPEYQFSQFGLEMESILREYTDESGQAQQQELLTNQDLDKRIPTIRSNDDLVSVFYSLAQQQYNRLTPIDGEQELIFGLGANEVRATISSTGEVRFDNLAHLDLIDPTDLLTLRLYLNHDAGNTLWEWAFTRNGLHVYYQVPGNTETRNGKTENDIEILSLLDDEKTTAEPGDGVKAPIEPKVRTLGGMRLRYRYIQPSMTGLEVTKVTWSFAHAGRYCTQYGVDASISCNKREANVPFVQQANSIVVNPDWSVYWEPLDGDEVDWSNWAGTGTDDAGVAASLKAEYTIPVNDPASLTPKRLSRVYERTFTVNTRELKPETDPEKVMKGSDVQILEAMLWQFGISPQYGFPGYVGTRIDAISPASLKKPKNEYSAGWENNYKLPSKDQKGVEIAANVTAKKTASIEMMVRRFKGRSFSISDVAGANQTGNIDGDTLAQLGNVWLHYYNAYVDEPTNPYTTDSVPSTWWDGLASLLTSGGNIPYQKAASSYSLSALDPNLNAITANFPADASGIQMAGILQAWSDQESGGKIRGTGDPVTPYRTHEGGGDNEGSMGFNHVLWKRMYGKENSCKTNRGYVDGKHNINLYLPFNSLQAFLAAAADKDCSTSAGLHKAYSGNNSYSVTIAAADKPFKYCYETTGRGTNTAGTRCSRKANKANWLLFNDSHDAGLNLLGKAVMAYNHGTGDLNVRSYFSSTNTGLKGTPNANGTNFDYWLRVKEKTYQFRNTIGGYLPLVSYIWKGGKYPKYEFDENGEIKKDENDQPILHPKSEQDWCFVYGEKEWISGQSWSKVKAAAASVTPDGDPKKPNGDVSCQ